MSTLCSTDFTTKNKHLDATRAASPCLETYVLLPQQPVGSNNNANNGYTNMNGSVSNDNNSKAEELFSASNGPNNNGNKDNNDRNNTYNNC